ncbi:hypothetical protein BV902_12885 [Sphingobacterium sp. B29]|uniref:hypothetical protein n=1 Tax=Sphingobacterium sp. B29 TaxID=1933220 RepID=UPI0009582C5B|nr:hypothetical protein [Sphingobacterium sp. B29]APU97134.1 hypothetical protein BV902_12885 [Sphingobacterium sp. B29]
MANQFLIKETMDAMRNLSATEIDGLKGNNPIYAGVELLGYYEKGDTPSPIIYYLAPTTPDPGIDDGGSVIVTTVGSKLVHHFDIVFPEYFGAKGDGLTDDSTAIIKANRYAVKSKSTVFEFLPKTYSVGKFSTPNNILFVMISNLTVNGNGAILKLQDHVLDTAAANVKFIYAEGPINNFKVFNLTLDFNGVNNFVPGVKMNFCIAIGCFFNSDGIIISGNTILNNPARQSLLFGDGVQGKFANNILITDNVFKNFGNAISGNNSQDDHSVIYLCGENPIVTNNSFINERDFIAERLMPLSTAVELHSSASVVTGNVIKNFKQAFVIAAMNEDQKSSIYANNVCNNIGRLAEVWSKNNCVLDDILIADNIVTQSYYLPLIDAYTNTLTPVGKIVIENNIVENTRERLTSLSNPSFYVKNVKNVIIRNNQLKKIPGGLGLFNGSSEIDIIVDISNNSFTDCGNTDHTAAYMSHRGFLFNLGKFKEVRFYGNNFYKTEINKSYIDYMFQSDSAVDVLHVTENISRNINDIQVHSTAEYSEIVIKHTGSLDPRNIHLRASFGSTITDISSNVKWEKIGGSQSWNGWRKITYADNVPTNGNYVAGDLVYNNSITAVNPELGWTCITNGTPGVWKAI